MSVVELLTLNADNLGKVQMFCGHSPTYRQGYRAKIEWARTRLAEGWRYTLLTVDGRNAGMLETAPAENGWRGVDAPGYHLIHCLWVVGRNRKHGYGRKLLENALAEAQETNGLVVLSSRSHWLPTRKIFLKNGFQVIDEEPPFELLALRLKNSAPLPSIRRNQVDIPQGLVLYQANQCPYMQNLPLVVKTVGSQLGIPVQVIQLDNPSQAQAGPCPYGVLGIYLDGQFLDYRPLGTKSLLAAIAAIKTRGLETI